MAETNYNSSREAKWKAVEQKRALNKYHGPILRKGERWSVYNGSVMASNLVGQYETELEAVEVWDNLQRQTYAFPAPVNLPTVEEFEARTKERAKASKNFYNTESKTVRTDFECLQDRVRKLEAVVAYLNLDTLSMLVAQKLETENA